MSLWIVLFAVAAGVLRPAAAAAAAAPLALSLNGLISQGVSQYTASISTLVEASQAFKASINLQMQNLSAQAEELISVLEAEYCTPAQTTNSTAMPATFFGHGFALTFATGNCTFDGTQFLVDGVKELDCFEPSISYVKTPANFTSHYTSAQTFTTKECKVEKTFGEPMDKVLYVFDETSPLPNASQLVQQINAEVVSVLATLTGIS